MENNESGTSRETDYIIYEVLASWIKVNPGKDVNHDTCPFMWDLFWKELTVYGYKGPKVRAQKIFFKVYQSTL